MEKKEFLSLSVTRVSNDDVATLFQLTIEAATPHKPLIGEMANVAFTNFEARAKPFIEQINRLRESPLTKQIIAGRKVNNDLMSEIKRRVVFETKSRIEPRRVAAEHMDYFYKPYWDLSIRPLGNQIKDTTEMIGKYETEAGIAANGQLIEVDVPMMELKMNNSNLFSLYMTRNEETGGRAASGTDLRPAANETYVQFCNVMEQLVNLMPNDAILSLFNSMEALRIKAHALLSKPKVDEKEVK